MELARDFWSLLEKSGHPLTRPMMAGGPIRPSDTPAGPGGQSAGGIVDTHGTTVIAVKFDKGVLNVGDRRATANFAVMYDKAEKVLPIDDFTLLAISGSFARAMEVVRYLRTSFKLFERTYLQDMSLDGKLAELACLDDEASEVAEVVVPQRDDLTGERAPACMVVALFVVALFSMATKWGNCGFSLFLARPDRQFAPV